MTNASPIFFFFCMNRTTSLALRNALSKVGEGRQREAKQAKKRSLCGLIKHIEPVLALQWQRT